LDLFPRYNVLAAIRSDVERFVPADFRSQEELRAMLVGAGGSAESAFTHSEHPVAIRAITDERRRFIEFARTADVGQFADLPRLPFRRVLGDAEHKALHEAFIRRWGRWYGGSVNARHPLPDVVTLHEVVMEAPGAYDHLRLILAEHGVTRLFELRESGDGYELDTAASEFIYNGDEGFWTAGEMEWMVYASHESSITFGGPWLAAAIRPHLPDFDRYLYRGWDLAAYQ
jgi:hypothetical protein